MGKNYKRGKNLDMIYDCAIIGTGPAGLSAALNLKIHNKSFLWFGSSALSDKVRRAEQILNYPALSNVSGEELAAAFSSQIADMGIEINESMVNSIIPMGEYYAVAAGSEFFEAKTVILATGVAPATTIEGEADFLGRGVSYCATCDGNLYRGKKIAVLCTSARFEHEVKYLAELAERVLFFPYYKNASPIADNVQKVMAKLTRIEGERKANAIVLGNGEIIGIDGVFCLRESITPESLMAGLKTDDGHIRVDRNMHTDLAGVFAAGDCVGRPYQYVKAAGEGNVAAHSVIEYLAAAEK